MKTPVPQVSPTAEGWTALHLRVPSVLKREEDPVTLPPVFCVMLGQFALEKEKQSIHCDGRSEAQFTALDLGVLCWRAWGLGNPP